MSSPHQPRIYLDHASTYPIRKEVAATLMADFSENFGNPSSLHQHGLRAKAQLNAARATVASLLGIPTDGVIFTGSATEASNLALQGFLIKGLQRANTRTNERASASGNRGEQSTGSPASAHIITSPIEHPSVLEPAKRAPLFAGKHTVLRMSAGTVDPSDLRKKLEEARATSPSTPVLVSIQRVNGLLGAVQPVEELAKLVKQTLPSALFHCDCTQAVGRVSLPSSDSNVDFYSISAHKFGGPRGIGALIAPHPEALRHLAPLLLGGGQECGLRSGTQAPGLATGLARALELALAEQEQATVQLQTLKNLCVSLIVAAQDDRPAAGSEAPFTPNGFAQDQFRGLQPIQILSPPDAHPAILMLGLPADSAGPVIQILDQAGISASAGSACHSGKREADPVLSAFGLSGDQATSTLRLSFSGDQSLEEIKTALRALSAALLRLDALKSLGPTRRGSRP